MAPSAEIATNEFGVNDMKGEILYQDDQCVVLDVEEDRQAPVHFRVVPKKALSRLPGNANDEKLLGHLLQVARSLASEKGLNSAGHHLMVDESLRSGRLRSLHVFGRALHHMLWPVGPGTRL